MENVGRPSIVLNLEDDEYTIMQLGPLLRIKLRCVAFLDMHTGEIYADTDEENAIITETYRHNPDRYKMIWEILETKAP